MGLEINEPLVLATKQKFKLGEFHQDFVNFKIVYTVLVKDQDDKLIRVDQIDIVGPDYNSFKDNFDVYAKIVAHYKAVKGLNLDIPDDFEASLDYELPEELKADEEKVAELAQSEPEKEIAIAKADGTSLIVKVSGAIAALAAAGVGAYFYFLR